MGWRKETKKGKFNALNFQSNTPFMESSIPCDYTTEPLTCKLKTEEIKPRLNVLKCILLSIQLPNKLALLTGQ